MIGSESNPNAMDVQANPAEMAKSATSPLFKRSPSIFGLEADVRVYPTVRIAIPWNIEIGACAAVGNDALLCALGPIHIGPRSTVSKYAHLCARNHNINSSSRVILKTAITFDEDVQG